MKDLDKILRKAVFDSLDGNLSGTKVFDEVKKIGDTDSLFVLLGGQRSIKDPSADNLWARRNTIEIIITHKQTVSVTKDLIDEKSDEILEILFPSYDSFIAAPSGVQFLNPDFESGVIQPMIFSNETIMAKVLTISVTIIQQLN